MTQRQEFTLLRTYGDIEVREYKPCVIAEVKVSAQYSIATSSAFGSLFRYISKGNQAAEKIAMTAPVIAAQRAERSDADEWFVSFVMPAGSNREHLPDPNDPNVHLRELPAETCVALSFRGKATEDLSAKKALELRAAAAKEKISLSDETRICRFDPPVKPGFLQYNEIVIPAYLNNSLI
ncbi:SOUL haem-binding protein [Candidatus Nanopelagicaceae bacterium]